MYSRLKADEYVSGVPFNSHKRFGTPQEAWSVYEERRRANFVQILPFMPVPIPSPTPSPSHRYHEQHQCASPPDLHQPSPPSPPFPSPASQRRASPASPSPTSQTSSARASTAQSPASSLFTATSAHTVQSSHTHTRSHSHRSHRHNNNAQLSSISEWQRTVGSPPSVRPDRSHIPHSQSAAPRPASHISQPQLAVAGPSHQASHPTNLRHDANPMGVAYASGSVVLPSCRILQGEDPWDDEAAGFVVFHGAIPGIYETWYVDFITLRFVRRLIIFCYVGKVAVLPQ